MGHSFRTIWLERQPGLAAADLVTVGRCRLHRQEIAADLWCGGSVSILVFVSTPSTRQPRAAILGRDATPHTLENELNFKFQISELAQQAGGISANSLAAQQPVAEELGDRLINSDHPGPTSRLISIPLSIRHQLVAALRREKSFEHA